MTLDLLDFFKKGRGKFGFVATYEFDPQFFERRILTSPAFDGGLVVVFVDESRYRDILLTDRQGSGFDRNYFVIPIRRADGVFHPKLYLSLGNKKALACVGSNNCTSAGTGHNFELISAIEAEQDGTPSDNAFLVTSIFNQFAQYAEESGPVSAWLKKYVFEAATDAYPWLKVSGRDDEAGPVEFLSSHRAPLWPQVTARLSSVEVQRVSLLAPFFGKTLQVVERVRALWPRAPIQVISQSGYSNLPIDELLALQKRLGNVELISASSTTVGRNLHAKALAFEAGDRTYWLAGSANMSDYALTGGNSEACLWFSTSQTVTQVLEHDDLTFAALDPKEFVLADIVEPKPQSQPLHALKLASLVLTDDRRLLVECELPSEATDIKLRIFLRREITPTLSWDVKPQNKALAFSLSEEDVAKFDRPATGQLSATIDGRVILSPPCSVQQLPRLLRERGAVGQAGNRLQRVLDSGDGLVEYVDTLEGVDAAIDFMNNTTIRFYDQPTSGHTRGTRWRASDPFSGDVPDHWELGSKGGSIAELREAIWNFVQRHVETRLQRHANRGNLAGLENYLNIFRAVCRLLLSWHARPLEGETVITSQYVTTGIQAILSTLVGAREPAASASLGYGKALFASLRADEDLVRTELNTHQVSALVRATVEEMIRVRSVALKRSPDDDWSQSRRAWVQAWIDDLQLEAPTLEALQNVSAEFKLAA